MCIKKRKTVRGRILLFLLVMFIAVLPLCLSMANTVYADQSEGEEETTHIFSDDYELYKGDTGESGTGTEAGQVTVSSQKTEDFRGQKIAAVTGATVGPLLEAYYDDDVEIVYFDSFSDCIEALETDKVAAYGTDCVACVKQLNANEDLAVVYPYLDTFGTSAFFAKGDDATDKLLEQFNEFITKMKEEDALEDIFQTYASGEAEQIDMTYSGENGTIRMAVCSTMGIPFCYYSNNELNGYELYLASEFAKEYGYKLEFTDYNFAGMLAAVSSGICDFGASGVQNTYERSESVNFSEPDYYTHHLLVTHADTSESESFIDTVVTGFDKTFVQENRWQMFLTGLGTTLLITVLAAIFGTVLGYFFYKMSASQSKVLQKIIAALAWLVRGMPVVVLLMIFYYLIFQNAKISGTWVAIIAFTLTFAVAMMGMIKNGVGAIDKGQYEGAQALGYSKRQTFRYIIFPQAVNHFMPLYASEIVALIKATAVVGYIAVQDLTKISDIIRSMTFDAFFPLIAVAILYFILGAILTAVVRLIAKKLDYKQRKKSKILKGVKEHD